MTIPHPQDPGAPTVLAGRYELGARLGQGGMADVYRGIDRVLGRPVAVKVLRDSAADESDRARFVVEARTLARLSHPGLVTVLDAGIGCAAEDAAARPLATPVDQPFLVMELVDGPTLAQVLADGPLDPAEVRSVGVRLADALAYVHSQGVVHRDVKPGNVLLDADRSVKLTDFGIVRLLDDNARHTRTGQTIGTAAYLAPEQVTGGAVTSATDVYALGLLLLEAVTGSRVYPGPTLESALARLHRPPEIPQTLPAAWQLLLDRMTAIDPRARPSATEVADQLRAAPTGSPAPAASPALAVDSARETPTAALSVPPRRTPAAASGPSSAPRAGRGRRRRGGVPPRVLAIGVPAALAGIVAAAIVASPLGADAGTPSQDVTTTQEPLADDVPSPSGSPAADPRPTGTSGPSSDGSASQDAPAAGTQPESVAGVGYSTGASTADARPQQDAPGRAAGAGATGAPGPDDRGRGGVEGNGPGADDGTGNGKGNGNGNGNGNGKGKGNAKADEGHDGKGDTGKGDTGNGKGGPGKGGPGGKG
ncbi:serine/threonine-protein kinase [Puerhibacterium puerhi]|uniref:serine/threonine-protein kinase n=1 Tax=Puerhibacterium puerhi TaxID=2692623 RepID=UPI001358D53D|nr:serine/threonine-protein kinase [Puerhibacterium puerhi]